MIRTLTAWAAILAMLTGGCVTETSRRPQGVPVRSDAQGPSSSRATPAPMPTGVIAEPVRGGTSSAAVRIGVVPLGEVFYDGQRLPLFSPNGRYAAVQSGEAPAWPTILAEIGAPPANRTSITVFDCSANALAAMPAGDRPEGGLELGRSADDEGFLVESQQRDGPRWIGKVAWATGSLTWLAKDDRVNAHGVLTAAGGLLWTRRAVADPHADLVLQEPGREESVIRAEDGSFVFPLATDDPGVVFAQRISKSGLELEVVRVTASGGASLGSTIVRRSLSASADPLLAHQVAATVQGPLRLPGGAGRSLVALSPRHGRMGVFDLSTGLFKPLNAGSVAAVPSPDRAQPGWFCTTMEGLTFVPRDWEKGPVAAVLPEPFVATPTTAARPTLMLVGPVRGQPDRLQIVRAVLAVGE